MAVPATLIGIFTSCIVENCTPYKHIANKPGIKVNKPINIAFAFVPNKITRTIETPRMAPPTRNHAKVDLNTLSASHPPNGAATNITT